MVEIREGDVLSRLVECMISIINQEDSADRRIGGSVAL
jgi:hypothetical protein